MTSYRRKSIFLLILILLGAFVASGLHHHDDGHPHADCSACVAGSLFSPAAPAISFFVAHHPVFTYGYEPQETSRAALYYPLVFSPRGPPLS